MADVLRPLPIRSEARQGAAAPRRAPGWRDFLPAVGVLAAALLWEAVSRTGLLPATDFPSATDAARALVQEAATPKYWRNILDTLLTWSAGLVLGVVVAVTVGVPLGRSAGAYRAMRLLIEALRPIPAVALIPLAVLLFGIGHGTKLALICVSVFWPMLMQTIYGMRDVDAVALDTVRSFRLGGADRVRWLLIPSAMPYFMTGLRISASIALIVGIATELVIGAPGIGAAINEAQASGARPQEYALIATAGLLGWGVNALFRKLEARVLHWHPSVRAAGQ